MNKYKWINGSMWNVYLNEEKGITYTDRCTVESYLK